MKLFLSSAGLPQETRDYFVAMLNKPAKKNTVCFITTAAYPEVDKQYIEQSFQELKDLGFEHIDEYDIREKTQEQLQNELNQYDIIYVNGGNTFFLMKHVQESGFGTVIKQLLQKGKIYIGVSAGSIITCPDISVARWEPNPDTNVVNLTDLSGLNIIPFIISPHCEIKDREITEKQAKNTTYPVVALTDKQAIIVENTTYKIVGAGETTIFNDNQNIFSA